MASLVDLSSLARALGVLDEALLFWKSEPDVSPPKKHLRSAVVQSFEFTYKLCVRSRRWREARNATNHAYREAKAIELASAAEDFAVDAKTLLAKLEASLAP